MKPVKLRVVSRRGVEASVSLDASPGAHDDSSALVSITGGVQEQKIYGIDPVQAFSLALRFVEQMTEDARIGPDDEDRRPGAEWWVEVVDT